MKNSQLILFVYTIFTLLIGSIYCQNNNNLVTNQTALFVFGDSLYDAGNNKYIVTQTILRNNIFPYGRTTFKFPTGRISDGRLIPDFLAEYARLPLIPPHLQPGNGVSQFTYGVSFATASAGALDETFPNLTITLRTQLNSFKNVVTVLKEELGDEEANEIISRAVYLFHIGTNDYLSGFATNSTTFLSNSKEIFTDFVIGNTTDIIEEIYKLGGRKFGFMKLGPYDCVAGSFIDESQIGSCLEPVTELIKLHNEKIPNVLKQLERKLSGFKYVLHDYHTSLSQRINNPSKYGFKEGKKACCGRGPLRAINSCGYRFGPSQDYELCENVTDYLFFDSLHMTEKAHQQIADLIWNGPSNVNEPYNLKTLFGLN